MLLKLIIVGALIWLLWRMLNPPQRPPERRRTKVADTVRCAYCDTHLPASEALRDGDAWYCNEAHHRAALQKAHTEGDER